MAEAPAIFIVVNSQGHFVGTTLDANQAADWAFDTRGLYGELTNVQDFRNATEISEVPPKIMQQIEDFIDGKASGVRRGRPLRKDPE